MLNNTDSVIEWLRVSERPYWKIRRSEKGPVIFETGDPDNFTIDDSIALIQQYLGMLSNGNYYINAYRKANQTGITWSSTPFFHNRGSSQGIGNVNPGIGALSVEQEVARQISELELKRENEELKKLNQELEAEISGTQHSLIKRTEPYIVPLLKYYFPGVVPETESQISGIDQAKIEDAQERLENAFARWYKYEKDPVVIVERIAELAEKDPATYNMAKNLLFNKTNG